MWMALCLTSESSFCYLGDMLCAGGGCELAIITRCCTACSKFKKTPASSDIQACIFQDSWESVSMPVSDLPYCMVVKTWAPSAPDLQRLRRNDRSMKRWICSVKPRDDVPIETLHAKLGIQEVTEAL